MIHLIFWFLKAKLFFLGCAMQDLSSLTRRWTQATTVKAQCRISVPWPDVEPRPQQWKHWIVTTRPPGNSLKTTYFFSIFLLLLNLRKLCSICWILISRHFLCRAQEIVCKCKWPLPLFFFPRLCGMWDLTSSTGDWTCSHCREARSLNYWTTKEVRASVSWMSSYTEIELASCLFFTPFRFCRGPFLSREAIGNCGLLVPGHGCVVVQSLGCVQLFVTPCPRSTPDSSVLHCLRQLARVHVHWVGNAI